MAAVFVEEALPMWLLLTIVVVALLLAIGWAFYRRRHPRLERRHRIDIPDRMPPRGYWPGHNG